MPPEKRIALVAHDARKPDLIEWVEWNHRLLLRHHLICTGTTGAVIERALAGMTAAHPVPGLDGSSREAHVTKLKSGPLGGDQQLGAMIADGAIDALVFFWEPMEPHPHDVDVKALLRIAVVYDVPTACNRSSADFLVSSPLMHEPRLPGRAVERSASR